MAKKLKNIILTNKRTTIEINDVDGWIYDLKYIVNNKEAHSCQIIKTDLPGRIERFKKEGFKLL